ncbi:MULTISPECIES: efflux RND transporter periplasmic adaptor subunit [unclassified Novosphingobium]|uniref:efflux RND transporter periplasmic adaptor subunit n=1 Tax=unclassified Novosphingobium TaxID=2644732 RepID=UPI00146D043C|nr:MULTISPECIES: efflux RND transporter periplasmic adaptor subunit [unclassified Novosphingobium]NMN04444.1 RND family efflux transporter MFP subunit [Novosphingobium sp. SG919]NMN85564.1 RND family efflux transporter MFP subunit [Novosphingobium sp. SG916]
MQNETSLIVGQEDAPANPPRGLKTAGIVSGVIAAVIVGAGLYTRHGEAADTHAWSEAQAIPTVHLVDVTPAAASGDLTLPGTMAAWNTAHIFARVPGYMQAWSRDIGASVGQGTPLAQIETPELDQQIVAARAALAKARAGASLARSTAARWNDLLTDHSVSQQEADERNGNLAVQVATVRGAEADLARLLAMKAYATVRAPFAGVVTQRNADIGDLVGPGATNQQPMFTVADVGRIRIYVGVPQTYAAAMKPGVEATLTVPDQPGQTFAAKVVGTSDAINPQTGALQVQLLADNTAHALRAGGYAQVAFKVPGGAGAVTIPSSALLFRAAGTQVATVGGDARVRLVKITLGRDLGKAVEVVSGLSAGAKVIDNPPDSIADGDPVHVDGGHHG